VVQEGELTESAFSWNESITLKSPTVFIPPPVATSPVSQSAVTVSISPIGTPAVLTAL